MMYHLYCGAVGAGGGARAAGGGGGGGPREVDATDACGFGIAAGRVRAAVLDPAIGPAAAAGTARTAGVLAGRVRACGFRYAMFSSIRFIPSH